MPSPPASVEQARELVNRNLRSNGFVRQSSLEKIEDLEVRQEIEDALRKKDERIGASALTYAPFHQRTPPEEKTTVSTDQQFPRLSKTIYTSSARFVFELLQNTDDNNYSTAIDAGQDPFMSFKLYHDRVVVDCNENGFTDENLTAICDIGNSSKTKTEGYIGEKGIGFKSVFMAAWKVHIQSGFLSFSFVHEKGNTGMGMVQPIWEDSTEAIPQTNYTRMTLFLHQDNREGERKKIKEQLKTLEPAILLFVQRLKRIDITFYDEDGEQEWATRLTKRPASKANCEVLDKYIAGMDALGSVTPESHIYHVTKHLAKNVARHEHRELAASEEADPSFRQSEIVLAFPVSAEFVPVIEPQKVFSFLPMRQMGFNVSLSKRCKTPSNYIPFANGPHPPCSSSYKRTLLLRRTGRALWSTRKETWTLEAG